MNAQGSETIKAMHTKFYRAVKNALKGDHWPLKSAEKSIPDKYNFFSKFSLWLWVCHEIIKMPKMPKINRNHPKTLFLLKNNYFDFFWIFWKDFSQFWPHYNWYRIVKILYLLYNTRRRPKFWTHKAPKL